MVAMATEGF